jgi:membrane protease YdiL (CAAX protease family)
VLDQAPAWVRVGVARLRPGRGRPPSGVPWDWTDLVLFFLLFLTGLLLLGAIASSPAVLSWGRSLLRGLSASDQAAVGSLVYQTAYYAIALVCVLGLALGRRHARFSDLGWRLPRRWWWLLLAVPVAAASLVLLSLIAGAIQWLFPQAQNGQIPQVQGEYGTSVGLAVVAVSVVAPVVEETFFRGFVYAWMRRQLNVPSAALLSGCFFALVHFQPVIFVPLAVLGVGLALLYEYSGSVLPGMVVHALFNLVEVIAILVPGFAFP